MIYLIGFIVFLVWYLLGLLLGILTVARSGATSLGEDADNDTLIFMLSICGPPVWVCALISDWLNVRRDA